MVGYCAGRGRDRVRDRKAVKVGSVTVPLKLNALAMLAEAHVDYWRWNSLMANERIAEPTEQRDGYERMWRNSASGELELKRQVAKLEAQIEKLKKRKS